MKNKLFKFHPNAFMIIAAGICFGIWQKDYYAAAFVIFTLTILNYPDK